MSEEITLEKAQELVTRAPYHKWLGLKVIAVHKVVPNGLTPLDPYRIDDLERVAIAYPRLNFEIVHGGLPPFVDRGRRSFQSTTRVNKLGRARHTA